MDFTFVDVPRCATWTALLETKLILPSAPTGAEEIANIESTANDEMTLMMCNNRDPLKALDLRLCRTSIRLDTCDESLTSACVGRNVHPRLLR